MNPSAVFTSPSSSGAGAARSPGASSASAREAAADSKAFDRHLQNDRIGKEAPSAAARRRAESTAATRSPSSNPQTAPAATNDTQGKRALDDAAGTPASAAAAGEASTASTEPTEDAAAEAWPPLGLAGLALSPVTVPGVVAPALSADQPALTASASGSSVALPTLPTPALQAPGLSAAGAAGPSAGLSGEPAPASLEQLPEALAFEAVLESTVDDGGDAQDPMASLLQPGALLPAARSLAETAALRGTAPAGTPVLGQEGFDEAISARIGWLADQKIGHAHIRISPDDMGTIDVRLQMDGDRIHATFASPHVDVRQALESSLPRLRELLGEQGFQLAHADVGQHAGEGGSDPRNGDPAAMGGHRDGEPTRVETTVTAAQLIRQRGLLDTYA